MKTLLVLAAGLCVFFAHGQDHINNRAGCTNAFQWIAKGGYPSGANIRIAFWGTPATGEGAGASNPKLCYRAQIMTWLRSCCPDPKRLAENNGALGNTGVIPGVFRSKEILIHGGAVYFVELADDAEMDETLMLEGLEAIVRLVRGRGGDVVFLYGLTRKQMAEYEAGKIPENVRRFEKMADHYGVFSLNMGRYAVEQMKQGKLAAADFFTAEGYPSDKGHAVFFEAVKPFLEQGVKVPAGDEIKPQWPKSLTKQPLMRAGSVPYDWAQRTGDWKVGQVSPDWKSAQHLAVCEGTGELAIKFKGRMAGVCAVTSPNGGDAEYSIDGVEWKKLPLGKSDKESFVFKVPEQNLEAAKEHEFKIRTVGNGVVKIGSFLIDGAPVSPYDGLGELERADKVYAGMKPVVYAPPATRWKNIEKFMAKLKAGGEVRMVGLGDSIMGDTHSSKYWLLINRFYPQSKVVGILSNRSGTGCWFYEKDNNVEHYVFRHKPDLLMIGGISQRDDIDAIRSTIRQVRAKSDCDILLIAPVFGTFNEKRIKENPPEPIPGTYRDNLRKLAEEEKCGFFDMTAPWMAYMTNSGMDSMWFMRDVVHANERGTQIIGRLMEAFFAPEK